MTPQHAKTQPPHRFGALAAILLCAAFAGCGGGDPASSPIRNGAAASTLTEGDVSPTEISMASGGASIDASALQAHPLFHSAQGLLSEPDDEDAILNDASARHPGSRHKVSKESALLPTRMLTPSSMPSTRLLSTRRPSADPMAEDPMPASPMVVTTYTPAQVRAAYGMHALPSAGSAPSARQAATMGAGQTIYVVNAFHSPKAVSELVVFNFKFGLPQCSTKTVASNATLPLPPAPQSGCELLIVHATAQGAMTATAPAYNASWATETALDIQWAHATAPYARIVLIQAPDASVASLTNAVRLANSMGPGAVSMSFGTKEGSWSPAYDSAFTTPGMAYFAATGDDGAAVYWPSASANVVAVGGTSLSYSGSGSRSETVWSGTGGGVSAFIPKPAYQANNIPGLGLPGMRSVADVAFNANPSTGQYVATIAQDSTSVKWISAGGTSLACPQWAGISAVANAVRELDAKPALGPPNSTLYGQVATIPGAYAASFLDISSGSNGTCAGCAGSAGYDTPTGLGTPNVANLVSALVSAIAPSSAPSISPSSFSGAPGIPLAFTVNATGAHPLSYSMSGAPEGMAMSSFGLVNWIAPASGGYKITFTATDTVNQLSSSAVYSVRIAAPPKFAAPRIDSATLTGQPGIPLSYNVNASSANPLAFALYGALEGMSIDSSGTLHWPNPLPGTHTVSAQAIDEKAALSSGATLTLIIGSGGPIISTATLSGPPNLNLYGTIGITDSSPTPSMSFRISGAPMGMRFSISGLNLNVSWPRAVAGSYTLNITATDSFGQTSQADIPILIR